MCQSSLCDRKSPWRLAIVLPLLILACATSVTAPGCGGCRQDPAAKKKAEEEKRKKEAEAKAKKEQKQPIKFGSLIVQPRGQAVTSFVKPGHWASATQAMKPNFENFVGDLQLAVEDSKRRKVYLDRSPFRLVMQRPVTLSKGKTKHIETTFFVPALGEARWVSSTLQLRKTGARFEGASPCTPIPSYQYHFVVLAKEPERYGYIANMNFAVAPYDDDDRSKSKKRHYRVVRPDVSKDVTLPTNPLTWTSIAYVLWDGVSPERFDDEQQSALVDWLHWGGQLIISGPNSLPTLRESFLAKYLPAVGDGVRQIPPDDPDLAELSDAWTLPQNGRSRPLSAITAWSGVKLKKHEKAEYVPRTGDLLVERRVGRGRVLVTAFQLDEGDFVRWPAASRDCFYNACLLRRPPREWHAVTQAFNGEFNLEWADDLRNRRLDAALISKLRYFSRDTGVDTNSKRVQSSDEGMMGMGAGSDMKFGGMMDATGAQRWKPSDVAGAGGVAAWNDFSASANAAREALREAAGIKVPKSSFVIAVLAIYLVVLVPLNWLFFHALGRVELAWVAAPIIAVAGTFVVVWQAQLDIGFVRSHTEIAVLELQGDHPRGHLTRYTAVYSSLGTHYDFEFDERSAIAAPFPSRQDATLLEGQSLSTVSYHKHDTVKLGDVPVDSNFTRMLHSEQMFALDGPIRLGKSSSGHDQVENRSQLELHDVVLLRRPPRSEPDEPLEGCWIGRLGPAASAALAFSEVSRKNPFADQRRKQQKEGTSSRLNLDKVIELAQDATYFEPGETRLIARVDKVLPGMESDPGASQVRGATLVLAHLDYGGAFPVPERDRNTRADIASGADLGEQFLLPQATDF